MREDKRVEKLPAILPKLQTRDTDKCKTTGNHNTQRARRKDAAPINRANSRDLLALCV